MTLDMLALALGYVAFAGLAHYVVTRVVPADWRPGGEEEER